MPVLDPRVTQLQADLTTVFADVQRAQVAGIKMLAHYTSQKNFASVLASKELWFSDTRTMNDIEEIRSGGALVADLLEEIGPEHICTRSFHALGVGAAFRNEWTQLEAGTYVFSLSDHGRNNEADRVAMWGLYGHNGNGVCLVFKRESLLGQNAGGQFPAKWTQVEYGNRDTLAIQVATVLDKLEWAFQRNSALIRAAPAVTIGAAIAKAAMTLVPAHKHPSFEAEREVRFVHTQGLQLGSLPMGAGIQKRNGRNVFVLPLRKYPEYGVNADIADLLDHIIVEPSDDMDVNVKNVKTLLDSSGLGRIEVRKSDSPFRKRYL